MRGILPNYSAFMKRNQSEWDKPALRLFEIALAGSDSGWRPRSGKHRNNRSKWDW